MKTHAIVAAFAVLAIAPAALAKGAVAVDEAKPKVQIALLLDTSSSMQGLIDQAKSQLWKVVNTFTEAERDGQVPFVEVALYEYGNNRLQPDRHWIRQVEPLTRDLDEISRELFSLSIEGGEEYCGAVIRRALDDLAWDASTATYKTIFIAGNEPFTQGPVDALAACRAAISKGIVVNSIHCGSSEAGVAGSWHDGPALAEGKFLTIDQNESVVHIDAPQDARIAELGVELNQTYLGYGRHRQEAALRQVAADRDAAAHAESGAAVQRALTKASQNYSNRHWDLIDACREDQLDLAEIPAAELPEDMRKMTVAERQAHVAAMGARRAELQKEIQELVKEREAHVTAERKRKADAGGAKTLDQAIAETVREQAAALGYTFGG